MNWQLFDLADEITIYYEQWSQDYDLPEELTDQQIQQLIQHIESHALAGEIYQDLGAWFNNTPEREDVMSDTLMTVLEDQFEQMFDVEAL